MISKKFSPIGKKAQMEMSVGTIVTIVLLMTVLILGLVLVRTIFKSSIENVNSVDQAVKNQINQLFSEDDSRRIVVYPTTRLITIKKGNQDYLGFAFSIRNTDTTNPSRIFAYEVKSDGNSDCGVTSSEALSWIKAGKSGSITLGRSSSMENPEFVRFIVPDTAPACLIRYTVLIDDGDYATVTTDLKVESS